MKFKKKILIIAVFVLCLIPGIVNAAANCSSSSCRPESSNDSDSSTSNGNCIGFSNCTSYNRGGVRLTLYAYDGSGNPTKIGQVVDIWTSNAVVVSDGTLKSKYKVNGKYTTIKSISNPLKSDVLTLRNSSSCSAGTYSSISAAKYYEYAVNNKFNYYIVDYTFSSSTSIGNYIYNPSTKKGWLKDNFIDYLDKKDYKTAAELFSTTESEIKNNVGNLYVSVELLQFVNTNDDKSSLTWKIGTVSEITTFKYMGAQFVNRLYISNESLKTDTASGKIGKLVGNSSSSYYLKAVKSSLPWSADGSKQLKIDKDVFCGTTYGMSVLYIPECCEKCTLSCSDDCSAYEEGSAGRAVCAKAWCATNDSSNSSCVSACTKTENVGCDSSNYNTCKTYTSSGSETKSSVSATCSSDENTETDDVTLSTKTCFDDGTEYSSTSTKYYKIECTETEKLTNLPNKQNVYVSSTGSANLYLGYTKTYTKTCQLYWRADSSKVSDSNWTTDYDKSQLKTDLKTYENIKNGNISGSNLDSTTKSKMKSEAATIYTELSKAYDKALARLEAVTAADYKISGSSSSSTTTATATITYATSSTTTSTDTVNMIPVYCFNTSEIKENYCTLESNLCSEDASAAVSVDNNSYKATTTVTIYYSVPSSYLAVYSSETGNAYRSLIDCSSATGSDSLCKEVEYTYAFDKITISLDTYNDLITSGYTLSIAGDGMCSQFTYDLTCDYDLEDDYSDVDCDDYCGTNIVCRNNYCPTECAGCDEKESDDCDGVDTCEKTYCSDYSGDEYITCKYDKCCSGECNGNVACINKCCISECEALYTSDDDIATCKASCECPNGICEDKYYYRSVSRSDPFPSTHTLGANWSGNETYITEASGVTDETNDTTNYEYKIELSSSDITAIKNQTTYSTVYSEYSVSTYASSVTTTNSEIDEYCSAFLYDYLYTKLGVTIDKSSDVGNKGCVIK